MCINFVSTNEHWIRFCLCFVARRVWFCGYSVDVLTIEGSTKAIPECKMGNCAASLIHNLISWDFNFIIESIVINDEMIFELQIMRPIDEGLM